MMDKKPEWLKAKLHPEAQNEMQTLLRSLSLNTVCESAACPNLGECFKKKTATFMILGYNCTRNCKFCTIAKDEPTRVDDLEPQNIAIAAKKLGLKHTVITSVTRDDLPDGGSQHFANTIKELKKQLPNSTVEVLIPDFKGDKACLKTVIDAKPDILNHNIETVKRLYDSVRPMAIYERSLELLRRTKELDNKIYVKSGIMVGLGETDEEVFSLIDELISVGCDLFTIGQYLSPSKSHLKVKKYIEPKQFEVYKKIGLKKGFKYVAAGPFVRSSYNAIEGMKQIEKLELQ